MRFSDRVHAGDVLGTLVRERLGPLPDAIVLGLPRGGVPVAARVARVVGAGLDVFVVRKLGVPGHEEFAMGAVASGGVRVLNQDTIDRMSVTRSQVDAVVEREVEELARREDAYRGDRAPLALMGSDVILVDDGIATGSSVLAAIEAVRASEPSTVRVAVPVAPPSTASDLRSIVDEVITVLEPAQFGSVGWWYQDFTQTTDTEVIELLA